MTIKSNRVYQDPYVAQIASNLSNLFAPPMGMESGSDAAGYATADAKRAEMNRLGRYFDMSLDPTVDLETLSRVGTGAGVLNFTNNKYGVDQGNATTLEQRRMMEQGLMERQLMSPISVNQDQKVFLPPALSEQVDLPAILEGNRSPLSETEWKAGQSQRLLDNGRLTDTDLLDAITGNNTPVRAIDPRTNQPAFMTPGAATRVGAQPYEPASAERVDNYLAVGPDGQEFRFPGIVGPDGRIMNANNGQVVPNVIRKEGTGGGMSFEADGQGGVRFTTGGTGNTVSQQTQLQGQRDAAARSARELQTLFDNISASDVGIAGNFNELLTNYGAQIWPEVARGDVTSMRAQMTATTMGLARSLAGDSRISDTDRRMAQEVMAGKGLGESLPGARAKIAALTVLHAYREKFAGTLAEGGEALPPINRAVVGQLVDDGAISPALAQTYVETMLSTSRGGPTQIPGMDSLQPQQPAQAPASPQSPPPGVDPADWQFLTPEERELFR